MTKSKARTVPLAREVTKMTKSTKKKQQKPTEKKKK